MSALPQAAAHPPRVLVPIGIPLGLRHSDSASAVFHVRRGREVFALDDDRLGAWHLARSMRHDQQSLIAAMLRDGVQQPEAAIGSLQSAALLTEVEVSAQGALLLCGAHRIAPLMIGLDVDADGELIVGVPGVCEHTVGRVFADVFRRSTATPTMLQALVVAAEQPEVTQGFDALAATLLGQLAAPLQQGVIALDAPLPAGDTRGAG